MKAEAVKRDSNIELLRILLMIGVIILHYNGEAGGFDAVPEGSANEVILHFLEAVCICAVDVFMIISGYFLCKKNAVTIKKPLELIIQVVFWNEALTAINCISMLSNASIDAVGIAKSLLTGLIPANYFVILYSVTYILAPYINRMIENITKEQFKKMIVTLAAVFSVWAAATDALTGMDGSFQGFSPVGINGSQAGYTIVNFIFMYIIGAYIRTADIHIKKTHLLSVLAICILFVTVVDLTFSEKAWCSVITRNYNSPLVITEAAVLFLLMREINIGYRKWINTLAKGSFTVFLLHTVLLMRTGVTNAVKASPGWMLIHIIACSVGIYLVCWLAYIVYDKTVGALVRIVLKRG